MYLDKTFILGSQLFYYNLYSYLRKTYSGQVYRHSDTQPAQIQNDLICYTLISIKIMLNHYEELEFLAHHQKSKELVYRKRIMISHQKWCWHAKFHLHQNWSCERPRTKPIMDNHHSVLCLPIESINVPHSYTYQGLRLTVAN